MMRTFLGLVLAPFLLSTASWADTTTLPKGWFMLPGTDVRMKFGGYVKLDAIHDFKPIGSPDFFNVATIPVDGSTGSSTHLHAKETRLIIDVRTPSVYGDVRGYVETDFYGSGTSLRIRRAFVDLFDHVLAGQEWSTFMDEDIIPNTLDYEKPGAYAFLRLPMIRFHATMSNTFTVAVALEDPDVSVTNATGTVRTPVPALTARARIHGTWGHIQLSGGLETVTYAPTSGGEQSTAIYAGNLSGSLRFGQDKLTFQVLGGPGSAKYRGGESAACIVDQAGTLQAVSGWGATLGYEHRWSDAFSSLVLGNVGSDDVEQFTNDALTRTVGYGVVNLLWHYLPGSFCGIEYLYGERSVVGGQNGTASRLQASIRYAFNL
jgi:hypothetical protein